MLDLGLNLKCHLLENKDPVLSLLLFQSLLNTLLAGTQ